MKKQVMNPFLPLWEYVPDGEPHVFGIGCTFSDPTIPRAASGTAPKETMWAGRHP